MRRNLTVKGINGLKPAPSGRRYDVADAIVPGFAIRVTDNGRKYYMLIARYPGSKNPARRTIGEVRQMDLAVARDVARDWLNQISMGIDPNAEKAIAKAEASANEETFEQVSRRFIEHHVYRNGLRSAVDIERIFNKRLIPEWGARPFVSVRRGDVARLLDQIEARAPVQADVVLAVISKLCNWYMARDEDYTSPIVRGMRRTNPRERARTRILNDEELRILWRATANAGSYGAFLRFALLTAQRRTKVRTLRWADIDEDGVWTIPSEPREKSNAKSLKLPDMALRIVKEQFEVEGSEYIFFGRGNVPINGMSKFKRLLLEEIAASGLGAMEHWTVHDLRRTARSLMSRTGVRPDVCERVLGHAIPGVEGIYDRYSYDREKGIALAKLAELVKEIVTGAPRSSEPIPFPLRWRDRQEDLRSTG